MSAKKRVIFCTYSSIYSSKVLEQLIVDSEIEIVAIINSTRVLKPSLSPIFGSIYQLKISGLRYSSYLFFVTDFYNWIQPLLKLQKWPLRSIHALAKLNDIPILDSRDINTTEGIDFISEKKPNLILCAHFNQLIKEPILNLENVECLNIHPSLLPNYKGVDPVFFAMRDNVNKLGVTVHRMNNQFDSGEILIQSEMKLDKSKSLLFNNCELFTEGAKLAMNWMRDNQLHSTNRIDNSVIKDKHYDSWPTRIDVKRFKKAGYRLMNFSGLWKQQ